MIAWGLFPSVRVYKHFYIKKLTERLFNEIPRAVREGWGSKNNSLYKFNLGSVSQ